jgi:hypothetical protein
MKKFFLTVASFFSFLGLAGFSKDAQQPGVPTSIIPSYLIPNDVKRYVTALILSRWLINRMASTVEGQPVYFTHHRPDLHGLAFVVALGLDLILDIGEELLIKMLHDIPKKSEDEPPQPATATD